ncbi:histidine phosphatase family protein [Chitiniphilus shinanonensis]|uniref:Histidine phosphatase family protein n=1 Tax=Chitiniphilus shinanonensis TaxID=553088 RepID=A0ABQ6BY96_9NEIS|nr:histidine phosphatase family protein [Chitiniphilus shinanonensis]GLS04863.1 histidine phosphatase family protein [Chitiniphilus shinanonensis]
MELILWRHAEAEDGADDLARALTERGHNQAARAAAWLKDALGKHHPRVVASQARRAQQTAAAFATEVEIDARINPDAPARGYLEAAGWPRGGGTVVLVGHQPTLGDAASLALAGSELGWQIKKSAIWWLHYDEADGSVLLKAVYAP